MNGRSRGVLQNGERKYLQTDRIILRHGPAEEVELVRSIFRQFALKRRSEIQIARWLNSSGAECPTGRPWTDWIIHNMLVNENYIGNIVYDRHPYRLRERRWWNPPDRWVKKVGAFEPVIEPKLFAKVQSIIAARKKSRERSNEELLKQLRIALHKHGRLSRAIIETTPGMSRPSVYQLRFGTLRNAYSLIGYTSERDCEYINTREDRRALLQESALRLATALAEFGEDVRFDQFTPKIEVGGSSISFRTARTSHDGNERHSCIWTVKSERQVASGMVVIIRLDASNLSARDFFLVPVSKLAERLRFSERSIRGHGLRPIATIEGVVRSVRKRLNGTKLQTKERGHLEV